MPQREGVIYPKFRDQFAVCDFEAEPMPVLSLYPVPPALELSCWEIRTCGVTGNLDSIAWRQLENLPRVKMRASLTCQIFNWAQKVEWEGVRLADFLTHAGLEAPQEGWFAFYSTDGFYFEVLPAPLGRDPRVLLAYGMDGQPLTPQYGGPLRLVVPFLQGYKSVKWLNQIRAFRQDPIGIKRLLGQSKTGWFGQLWQERSGIVSVVPGNKKQVDI